MCEIKTKNEVYDVALVSLLLILDILKLLVFLFLTMSMYLFGGLQ